MYKNIVFYYKLWTPQSEYIVFYTVSGFQMRQNLDFYNESSTRMYKHPVFFQCGVGASGVPLKCAETMCFTTKCANRCQKVLRFPTNCNCQCVEPCVLLYFEDASASKYCVLQCIMEAKCIKHCILLYKTHARRSLNAPFRSAWFKKAVFYNAKWTLQSKPLCFYNQIKLQRFRNILKVIKKVKWLKNVVRPISENLFNHTLGL